MAGRMADAFDTGTKSRVRVADDLGETALGLVPLEALGCVAGEFEALLTANQ